MEKEIFKLQGLEFTLKTPTFERQKSLIALNKKIKKYQGLELVLKLAADHGRLYGNNCGVLFSIRKTGNIKKRSKSDPESF